MSYNPTSITTKVEVVLDEAKGLFVEVLVDADADVTEDGEVEDLNVVVADTGIDFEPWTTSDMIVQIEVGLAERARLNAIDDAAFRAEMFEDR